jgi:hypothetical protein
MIGTHIPFSTFQLIEQALVPSFPNPFFIFNCKFVQPSRHSIKECYNNLGEEGNNMLSQNDTLKTEALI